MTDLIKAARNVSNMLTKKDYSHITRAMDECKRSTMLMKHGCVVTNGTKVLASGHNHYRTRYNDGFIKQSCSCHAEMDALRRVSPSLLKSATCDPSTAQSKSFKVRKKVGQRYEKEV